MNTNGIKVIPLDISESWDSKQGLREQAKRILSTAKDQNRDLTKEEAQTIEDLIKLSDQIDDAIFSMAGANVRSDDEGLYSGAFGNPTNKVKNLWGHTIRDLVHGNEGNLQQRGLSSTTGAALIQDPEIMSLYFGNETHMNPLRDLGVNFKTSDNYSQFPSASGEMSINFVAEGNANTADTAWSLTSDKAEFVVATCLLKINDQVLWDSNPWDVINQELNTAFTNHQITYAMQGSGSGQPTGWDNLSGINTVDLAGSAYDLDDYIDWTKTLISDRVRPDRIGFLHGASSWAYAAKFKDSQARYLDKPELLQQQTWKVSSAVKEDYTSTRTKIYGGDFSDTYMLFQKGSTKYGNGFGGIKILNELYKANNQTGVLAWIRYDIKNFRPGNLIRIDGVPLT